MKKNVMDIWPEINWIKDDGLKEKTLDAWVYAIEQSPLEPTDQIHVKLMDESRRVYEMKIDSRKNIQVE